MKKYLLLLIAAFTFQFGQAQEFHFIPKIGMSFANLTNTDGSMAPGLNIGVAAEFPIFEDFAIEPGIYYSMQGTRSDVYVAMDDMLVDGDLTYDMDYLNIPIYAKYYVYDGLYLFAGPQFGFNVQSSLNADAVNFEGSGEDMDIKDIVKVFDFSIGIGAGYQFDMGLNVSLNYNIGLTNTFDYGDTTSEYLKEEFDKCRNSVLQINLGWRF